MPIQTLLCMWSLLFNILKIYYTERKPIKRVDDLINVLLTYKEDAYWQWKLKKIFTQNIYPVKHQSDKKNSRNIREMDIVNEDLTVVNETNWKVKSQK